MKNILVSKLNKRIVSIITAIVMFTVSMPLADISNGTRSVLNSVITAAAGETYPIEGNQCNITTYTQLVEYSKAYNADPPTYQNVDVVIAIAEQNDEAIISEFQSIGTSDNPFNATMKIASSHKLDLSIDVPLFGYISDTAKITDSDDPTIPSPITLSRYSSGIDKPLFAESVVHNMSAADADYASWRIIVGLDTTDENAMPYDFAGLIGTIEKEAKVNISFRNDAVKEQSSGNVYGNVSSASKDVGLICQKMLAGSSLTVSIEAGANTEYSVTASNGNAGGLVGNMASGSTLTVSSMVNTTGAITASGTDKYAGGLVGYAQNAKVVLSDDSLIVKATVSGTSGSGGIFGYYKNPDNTELTVQNYKAECTLNGNDSGGLFGKLENNGKVTIDSTNTVTASRTISESKTYGGLIGVYTSGATSDELIIDGVSVNVSKSGTSGNYGGVIGYINDDSYIKFSGVSVNADGCSSNLTIFGGLVGYVNYAFIDAENVTINVTGYFNGGGIVGNMQTGVLRLSETTDLSGAKVNSNGQIVGTRGRSLIYAKNGWQLIRSSEARTFDDIGTWGEVLRFKAADFTEKSVLDVDETAHTVKIKPALTTISTVSDYAITALNIQLNTGSDVGLLKFDANSRSATILAGTITLGNNIDLTGTGLQGFTRDDGSNNAFSGILDGGNHTITLATGEAYGKRSGADVTSGDVGSGLIYRHKFIGLFSKTNGATVKDITIDGTIITNDKTSMKIGGLAGTHTGGDLTVSNVKFIETLNFTSGDSSNSDIGGMLASIEASNSSNLMTINISDTTFAATIMGNSNKKTLGGAIAWINPTSYYNINFSNITMSGSITNENSGAPGYFGGLIAEITCDNKTNEKRNITCDNIMIDGQKLTVNGNSCGSGLLGNRWIKTDVDVNKITVNDGTITYNNTKGFAGLVYAATGYWTVDKIQINKLTAVGSRAASFGIIVNQGNYSLSNNNSALYLELTNKDAYTINPSGVTMNLKNDAVFDELVAYCNYNGSDICNNGQAVVSIHTEDESGNVTVIMNGEKCNTYQNQTSVTRFNKNTRYYYNLDVIRKKSAGELTYGEKLLLWSVKNYAYSNIQSYFSNGFGDIISGDLDLKGLSYYPVDVSSVTVSKGTTVKFYNKEIEDSEKVTSENGNTDETPRSTTDNSPSISQHYLMQCGLFRNVSENVTVNGITVSGNVGKLSDGSGALVCGTLQGSSTAYANLTCSSVVLDGIKINGSTTASDYAPLLINKIGSYSNLTMNGVSTTADYKNSSITTAATSLIGTVGESTASNIKLKFSNIVLDARTAALSDSDANTALNNAYNTDSAIFSKATLLDSFAYAEGSKSSGMYNYKYSEDWNADDTPLHHVTYGKEVSETAEYIEMQEKYLGSEYYTSPFTPECGAQYPFGSGFLPYVYTPYKETDNSDNNHELMVNHTNKANLDAGCGTYNDPYIISSGEQLEFVAKLLSGEEPTTDGTIVNFLSSDNYKYWCENKNEHKSYAWDAGTFYVKDVENDVIDYDQSIDFETIQKSLATAYYKLANDITLSNTSFIGLGSSDSEDFCFKGVIDGSGFKVTNNSSYPLIINSTGSVVKDLTVKVNIATFTLTQEDIVTYELSGGCRNYGAVIGQVFGGDNIIDNVSVDFGSSNINVSGDYKHLIAVGGYIGVVRYGSVIFRNMDSANKTGLTKTICSGVGDTNNKYLYQNPIIGRVLDGYAVTESDTYKPKETAVTMKNGTKNYSIADIDKNSAGKISFTPMTKNSSNIYPSTVTVPDSQSLFLLGCIAMSGAGKYNIDKKAYDSAYTLFGYGNSQMVRHSDYTNIGNVINSSAQNYVNASKDCFSNGNNNVPYIIYKYTASTDGGTVAYPARTITSKNAAFTIELSNGGNYELPDGFRGIGSINDAGDGSQMFIYGIKGNGSTIKLNTLYQLYQSNGTNVTNGYIASNDNYDPSNAGLGLFNKFYQNRADTVVSTYDLSNDDYKITDLTISGEVALKRYKTGGSESDYSNNNNIGRISAGGLGGTYNYDKNCTIQLENVLLKDLEVFSTYAAGGVIGTVQDTSNTTITATMNCISADNLSVTAGNQAGGIVGCSRKVTYTVNGYNNGSNSTFKINTIEVKGSTTESNSIMTRVGGGLFGYIGENANLTLSNFDIMPSASDKGVIISSESALHEFLGGIIGFEYKSGNVNIDSCNIKDILIKNGSNCGGLVGRIYDKSTTEIKNTHVIGTTKNAEVYSYYKDSNNNNRWANSGGFFGFSKVTTMKIDNCSVEGYTLRADRSEGCAGFVTKSQSNINLSNSLLKNCTFKISEGDPIGGFVANLDNNYFYGYNLVSDNVKITNLDGEQLTNQTKVGDIVGYNNNRPIKVVGVSIQKDDSGIYASKSVGNGFSERYGYIIYCDYDGIFDNKEASEINKDVNITTATDNTAFATVNPQMPIDSTQFLTGDGISSTAVNNIIEDIDGAAAKAYQNVSADRTTFEKYKNKLSTFNNETGAGIDSDFPVLVVNDSNYTNVTEMINSYIHLLTNNSTVNYNKYETLDSTNHNGTKIYNVKISEYRLDETDNTFKTSDDYKATLARDTSKNCFKMTDLDYDSNYKQFTLLDVQFRDPITNSNIAPIVYHLYIPVMVEKMLKFDFKAAVLSGTTYNTALYTDGSSVMESYGTPVTSHITYSYKRTAQEWEDAINGEENILENYGKSVVLKSGGDYNLPDGTKLVLVDRNNYAKAYYSTIGTACSTSTDTAKERKLVFSSFTDADGNSFLPVSFCDLLERSAVISATESSEGTLFVVCDEAEATVRDGNGVYYRKMKDTDTGTTYNIKVTPKDGSAADIVLPVIEDYYISFFTAEASDSEPMRNITIDCSVRLEDDGMTPSHISNSVKATMILGNLYDQVFSFSTAGIELMSESNDTIPAQMSTVISIKETYKTQIMGYLDNASIHIYHGFIIEMTKTDETGSSKGVKGSPLITGTYNVGGVTYEINKTNNNSVIELVAVDNGGAATDIKDQLKTNGSVEISCNDLRIRYPDSSGLAEQFPKRPDGNDTYGVTLSANSNLAYVPENVVYSNISATKSDAGNRIYYRQGEISVATLNYNIPSGATDADELSKLGVNGLEASEIITAVGYYDISKLPEELTDKAVKVQFELTLYQKQDSGNYSGVNINDYLKDIKLSGISEGAAVIEENKCSFTFETTQLNCENGVYDVTSVYKVLTGGDFEQKNYIYANYQVVLTAKLLDANGDVINNSSCSDHLIYTNARICTELL